MSIAGRLDKNMKVVMKEEQAMSIVHGKKGIGRLFMLQFIFCCMLASGAFAAEITATHLDKGKNPFGCSACHITYSKKRSSLKNANIDVCLSCHGSISQSMKAVAKADISSAFRKRYKHPVLETASYHTADEDLPEKSASAPRHVSCQDCHRIHRSTRENPLEGVKGYSSRMERNIKATREYEVCYKCHSDSANLPYDKKNKHKEFDTSNMSFHPIEGPGRNVRVPSLVRPLNVSSTIDCTDCHGNDDPYGPKGPHGSNYEFLLKYDYRKTEGSESQKSYELCYTCHERQSILDNQSFKKHKEHVVYQRIPCSACHVSHGTNRQANLIEFDTAFTRMVPLPQYMRGSEGKPTCYLTCHVGARDIVHNSAFYSGKRWP